MNSNFRIGFYGAAGTVTGSRYLVRVGETCVLVDCGLFQGPKRLREKNRSPLPFDPSTLDAVLLTHAHLDHSGFLPALMKAGYKGPVFCTTGTADLLGILLPDSGHLQEEDARYANRKRFSKHQPALPLYTRADAEASLQLIKPVTESVAIGPGVTAEFHRAGHILGAAAIRLSAGGRHVTFSGDVGRTCDPVMLPPAALPETDLLVVESTYGNRRHADSDPTKDLVELVSRTAERDGVVLIPAFAVGRAQTILHLIAGQKALGKIPADLPVFLNSPMAINATEIFCRHHDEQRLSDQQCADMCGAATYVNLVEDSIALNKRQGPMVIVSASGMATGGRIVHHLKAFVGDPINTLLFVGFQAAGTRGAAILSGAKRVKIHGEEFPVLAQVAEISGFSAHADYHELLDWMAELPRPPERLIVTHGEPAARAGLQAHMLERFGWSSDAPELGEEVIF